MDKMAEAYAPMTKKATWPKEKIPANPMMTSQQEATTAQIRHMMRMCITKRMSPTKMGRIAATP